MLDLKSLESSNSDWVPDEEILECFTEDVNRHYWRNPPAEDFSFGSFFNDENSDLKRVLVPVVKVKTTRRY